MPERRHELPRRESGKQLILGPCPCGMKALEVLVELGWIVIDDEEQEEAQ